ncbi:MAG: hypothetical protein ACFE85_19260 [Candidatus Hodarchaeota archaeon]
MIFLFQAVDILNVLLNFLDQIVKAVNIFFLVYLKYSKYILIIIMLFIGILTLLKLRGVYFHQRLKSNDELTKESSEIIKVRLTLGCVYIIIASGILFNYLTYFLMWILEPLPDGFIFYLIDLINSNLELVSGMNILISEFPIIYNLIAFGSYNGMLHFILTVWYFVDKSRPLVNPRKALKNLIVSIVICLFCGFTTFMPYFL